MKYKTKVSLCPYLHTEQDGVVQPTHCRYGWTLNVKHDCGHKLLPL